jgi:uncharacterized membrane protein YfcA
MIYFEPQHLRWQQCPAAAAAAAVYQRQRIGHLDPLQHKLLQQQWLLLLLLAPAAAAAVVGSLHINRLNLHLLHLLLLLLLLVPAALILLHAQLAP